MGMRGVMSTIRNHLYYTNIFDSTYEIRLFIGVFLVYKLELYKRWKNNEYYCTAMWIYLLYE